ncbi:MAG: diphthamide biosynthesis enzyme Dph2 [Archaeoglobaceae archaeon]|nr:diphthamide biosynthesis enzyme Dph2 [Archaeoglobaceae archaeon]MDW8118640.1 diphthamide biosynthesis enzyme Dph2 [Archaeoglobaceae archaeon]
MRIGIQLPDGLKRRAIEICEEFGSDVILSGESCYGACDLDLSLLADVDFLYHYAHTRILKYGRIIYVPYFVDFDVEKVAESIKKIPERDIALISTAQYSHKLPELKDLLQNAGFKVELKKGSERVEYPGQVLGCNYSVLRDSNAKAIVFVGDGLFHAKGASFYSGKKVYAVDPINFELVEVDSSDFIRTRALQISKCVGLSKVGIIVSTKPGQKRLNLAEKLKKIALERGLKAIIVYINEITPDKLSNLPFDFYVNTACPRLSYDDFRRFEKPIITPTEFEYLLKLREEIGIDEID